MSIFSKSFDPNIRKQLELRERILSGDNTKSGILDGRSEQYLQYANNKTPFIRLSSGVDVVDPILQKYFGLSQQDELATRFILEGGTLLSTESSNGDSILSQQRSTFTGNSGIYGANDLGGTSDLGLRPMPGISGISVKSYGENIATLRVATVTLDCYTIQQLEALELLYMRPGYRVLLEWGHNLYFDDINNPIPQSVRQAIDVIKIDKTKGDIFNKIQEYRKNTSYNYDAMFGKVKNFSWEAQTNGSYRCTVEIISIGDIIDSLKINNAFVPKSESQNGVTNKVQIQESTNVILLVLDKLKTKINSKIGISNLFTLDHKLTDVLDPITLKEFWKKNDIVTTLSHQCVSSDPNSSDSSTFNYIKLKDLITIVNNVGILLEGEQPLLTIKTPLNPCLSHPYQISVDPYCCLVSPNYSELVTSYSDVLDSTLIEKFPYHNVEQFTSSSNDPNISDEELNEIGEDIIFTGDMNNILVEIDHILTIFDELSTNSDKEEPTEVALTDFIDTLMKSISVSTGNINNFILRISPTDETQLEIIDTNFVQVKFNQDYYIIPLMGVGTDEDKKEGTYVRNYRMSTQLTNDIATTVSIGAQYNSNIDGVKSSVFNTFNQGIIDRLQEPLKSSTNDTVDEAKNNVNKISPLYDALKKLINVGNPTSTITKNEAEGLKHVLNDFIQLALKVTPEEIAIFEQLNSSGVGVGQSPNSSFNENQLPSISQPSQGATSGNANGNQIGSGVYYKPSLKNVKFGSYTPIPLNLNITMDGIAGVRVGTLLQVPSNRLPFQYKAFDPFIYGKSNIGKSRIAFIVVGVDHNVSSNEGWVTILDCRMVMLNIPFSATMNGFFFKQDFENITTSPSPNTIPTATEEELIQMLEDNPQAFEPIIPGVPDFIPPQSQIPNELPADFFNVD
mgnify:CR=1 FL=1